MNLKNIRSFLVAATVCLAQPAQAAGILVIDPVGGMPIPRPGVVPIVPVHPLPGHPTPRPGGIVLKGGVSFGLRMQSADVNVEISDQVAKTYITQTFVNDTDQNLAGTYLFPLPDDTTFSSFSLHIDGKPVEGKILEAKEARETYEQIVRRMVDPGLLEYADYKTVRARIYPIPAHGPKKVELEYTQVLKAENGMLKYRFPLKTENETSPADELKVNVKLASKQGLRTIWSPSHTISVHKTDDHLAKVAYLEKNTVPDKDFVLYYSVSDKDMAANLLTHKSAGEDGYYMLTVTPPMEAKQIVTKDIVLVADTSGSMQGERMEQNKKALKYLVNALNPGDRFSVVQFNTDVEQFKDQLVAATPENKKAALAFIDDLEARGGTNLGDALRNATTMLSSGAADRPAYVVLMTDGEPTVGDTSVDSILKIANTKRDIRMFDFGVGYDVNTRLLNKLAEEHHGTAQYIEPDENLETALASFYTKIKTPVLSNVKIAYDAIQVKDVYPREVKDIFAGSQVLLIGKYKGSGSSTVHLTGTINGVQKAYSFPVSFSAEQTGNTYLPRLWAMRRIGHLTEVAQSNGDTREVVDEIVALSKKYGIISQYTSFLVTDPNERNAHGMPIGPVAMAPAVPMWGHASGGGGAGAPAPVRVRFSAGAAGAPAAVPMAMQHYVHSGGAMMKARAMSTTAALPPPPLAANMDSFTAAASSEEVFGDEGVRAASTSASNDVDYAPYMADVQRKVKKQWFPPKGNESRPVSATFSLNEKGQASNIKIQRSSGVAIADRAAMKAIGDANFRPLPTGSPSKVDLAFNFDYNVFNGSGSAVRDFKAGPITGKDAVLREKALKKFQESVAVNDGEKSDAIKVVEDKTFYLKGGFWTDSAYDGKQKLDTISFGSNEYFDLLKKVPGIAKYLSVGRQVIVVVNGHGYKVTFTNVTA